MSAPHTMFAGQALGLAELFNLTIGKKRLQGLVPYAPELSSPDGPSTGGGKQALQHIKLVAEGGGATLLIGTANLVDRQAELRSFKHVDDAHRQRFKGVGFQVDRAQYEALLETMRAFFAERKYGVTMTDGSPSRVVSPAGKATRLAAVPAPRASLLRMIVTMALSAALVVAVAAFFLRR
jgi:hypothetical protein